MDKFIHDLSTAYFWLAVIFVGIIINLASHYINTYLQTNYSLLSAKYQNRIKSSNQKLEDEIKQLTLNNDLRLYSLHKETRLRSMATIALIMSLFIQSVGFAGMLYISYKTHGSFDLTPKQWTIQIASIMNVLLGVILFILSISLLMDSSKLTKINSRAYRIISDTKNTSS